MGRTIASITQTWQEEEAALNRFKRALRKDDQILLDELLVMSRLHLAEASYASNLYPLDMYLIAILLELYKQLKSMQKVLPNADPFKAERVEAEKEDEFIQLLNATVSALFDAPQKEAAADLVEIPPEVQPEPANALNYADFEEAP
jgi:hypothetical protein